MNAPRLAALAALSVVAVSGCGGALAVRSPVQESTTSTRTVQVSSTFTTGSGTATTYDPALVPAGARVSVSSRSDGDGTTVTFAVQGLVPDRSYGAHAHARPCGAGGDAAGPHFQHESDPVTPSVDPAYANPRNEIWLDLTTDADGAGTVTATVPWGFERDRRAGSVVVHAMPTENGPGRAGTAGARAACVTVDF